MRYGKQSIPFLHTLFIIAFASIIFLAPKSEVNAKTYKSTFGKSRTHSFSVDPGSHSFQVDKISWYKTTKWYRIINNAAETLVDTDKSGILAIDPQYTQSFSTGNQYNIKAVIYDNKDKKIETHQWYLSVNQPNLIVQSIVLDNGESDLAYSPGDKIHAEVKIKNNGTGPAKSTNLLNTTDIEYYLGKGDNKKYIYIEKGVIGYLESGESKTDIINFGWTLPSNLPNSRYRIWVNADSSNEVTNEISENDNWGSSPEFTISTYTEPASFPWGSKFLPYGLKDDLLSEDYEGNFRNSSAYRYYYCRRGVLQDSDSVAFLESNAQLSFSSLTGNPRESDLFLMRCDSSSPKDCFSSSGQYIPWDSNYLWSKKNLVR